MLWVLTNALGFIIAFGAALLVVIGFLDYAVRTSSFLGGMLVGAIALLLAGALLGTVQSLVMPRAIARRNLWILWTTLGFGISLTALSSLTVLVYQHSDVFLSLSRPPNIFPATISTYNLVIGTLYWMLVGTTVGGTIGLAQASAFKDRRHMLIQWMWMSSIGWALALAVSPLVFGILLDLLRESWSLFGVDWGAVIAIALSLALAGVLAAVPAATALAQPDARATTA